MGFFGKLKNILFEDDEELENDGMPVYTKEEKNEVPKRAEVNNVTQPVEEPIKTTENTRFRNVKRDIDLNYDETDVLGEVPGHQAAMEMPKENVDIDLPIKKEEKKSPFLSFDEDEFERQKSRVVRNESRVVNKVKSVGMPVNNSSKNVARKANNNFSSTSTSKDTRVDNNDRYKINGGTLGSGKKPFTPSPVISPVYGILDKNYKKDDIVDKQGGMKREKIVKPIVHKNEEEQAKTSTLYEVDIDSVRKKAYGELEELENTLTKIEIPNLEHDEASEIINDTRLDEDVKKVEPSIEEQLDEKYDVSEIKQEDLIDTHDLDQVVEEVIEDKQQPKEAKKSKMLDELEKTSTLQILDDIEKELNSIKPISKRVEEQEDEEEPIHRNDDTLENDLFHLIDSMYQEGEEEVEDD